MVKVDLHTQLRAHTIIETVVSMTIASIILSLAFLTYINVASALDQEYPVYLEHEAKYHLDSLSAIQNPPENVNYVTLNGLEIQFERKPYKDYENAWLMQCLLRDSLQMESVSRKIVYKIIIDEDE